MAGDTKLVTPLINLKNRRIKIMKKTKKYILTGILSVLVMSVLLVSVKSLAFNNNDSADGEGTLVNEDSSRSQFLLNVQRNPNGKVTGQATLRNPSFKPGNGQNNQIKIDVTCLKVVGNIAIIGGTTKRKNNQTKAEAMYFAVEDGGESGADKIFRGFYFDDDPNTDGDAQLCQTIEPDVLVLEPIVAGKIQVNAKQ
jgi:hypothetical protein